MNRTAENGPSLFTSLQFVDIHSALAVSRSRDHHNITINIAQLYRDGPHFLFLTRLPCPSELVQSCLAC